MIPASWLPAAAISRGHLHWTAGGHSANAVDRKSYHLIREAVARGGTNLVRGDISIAANSSPIRPGQNYAAHTRAANSGAFGYGLAGMVGAVERPFSAGRQPIRADQWRDAVEDLAQMTEHYRISVSDQTLMTHAEVESNLGIAQRNKWDIAILPWDRTLIGARVIGDKLRDEVLTLRRGGSLGRPVKEPKAAEKAALPDLALTGVVTASWLRLRDAPNGRVIGGMPGGTRLSVVDHDKGWAEVVTPNGHPGFAAYQYIALDEVA